MDSVGIPWNCDIPVGIWWISLELMGESTDLVSLWWSCAVVGIGGVLWWVLEAGRVPVLVRGVGGLSWPFVVAGGHGGRSSHVVVCWWVRMGRLGWRCSPMDNDERRTVVVRRLGATSTSATWHRLKRMGVGTYLGWRRRASSPSGDGGWLSSSGGHRHGG